MKPKINHCDLSRQFSREQVLRDHRVHAAHDVDDLGHSEANRDAAQGIGVVRGQFGAGRQKLDGVARCQAHRRIEILVETHGDPVAGPASCFRLGPAIHAFAHPKQAWMRGSSPRKTTWGWFLRLPTGYACKEISPEQLCKSPGQQEHHLSANAASATAAGAVCRAAARRNKSAAAGRPARSSRSGARRRDRGRYRRGRIRRTAHCRGNAGRFARLASRRKRAVVRPVRAEKCGTTGGTARLRLRPDAASCRTRPDTRS